MKPHKKYLWKLERPRDRYQCPEVYCYPSGKPVTLMATESEAREWAKQFDGWTLVNG